MFWSDCMGNHTQDSRLASSSSLSLTEEQMPNAKYILWHDMTHPPPPTTKDICLLLPPFSLPHYWHDTLQIRRKNAWAESEARAELSQMMKMICQGQTHHHHHSQNQKLQFNSTFNLQLTIYFLLAIAILRMYIVAGFGYSYPYHIIYHISIIYYLLPTHLNWNLEQLKMSWNSLTLPEQTETNEAYSSSMPKCNCNCKNWQPVRACMWCHLQLFQSFHT
jgi:hypothetical protein